ncbi:hypothetical protein [Caulobacter sp. B11]|nr:hypothetical protein [Caulobacter sp. B11]
MQNRDDLYLIRRKSLAPKNKTQAILAAILVTALPEIIEIGYA